MAQTKLNGGTVNFDNELIAHMANSISFTLGAGELVTTAQHNGGGNVEAVHAVDLETKVSNIKISLVSTVEAVQKVKEIISKRNVETALTYTLGNFVQVFTNCKLSNDPELTDGKDTAIELEFTANPVA